MLLGTFNETPHPKTQPNRVEFGKTVHLFINTSALCTFLLRFVKNIKKDFLPRIPGVEPGAGRDLFGFARDNPYTIESDQC